MSSNMVTLNEMKQYLRVDFDDDDSVIQDLITGAVKLCMDICRVDTEDEITETDNAKIAVLYAVAYLYEHREDADHHQLTLSLRGLLFSSHEGVF